jgi:hypothetical protein
MGGRKIKPRGGQGGCGVRMEIGVTEKVAFE